MSDPIGRDVSPGEPLEIPADSFNLMMRAARRQRDREFGETGGEYGNNPLSAGARVYVRNDVAGGSGSKVTTTATAPTFQVVTPTGYTVVAGDAGRQVKVAAASGFTAGTYTITVANPGTNEWTLGVAPATAAAVASGAWSFITDLPGYSVLKLGTPLMDATDPNLVHDLQAAPIFPGTAPAAATDPFAITIYPIPTGEIGVAVVLGVVVCDIEVSDAAHGYAAPSTFTAKLVSAAAGPAKIIWKAGGTGLKRAFVALCGTSDAGAGGGSLTVEEVDGSPSYAATGTLRFDQADGFVLTQPGAGIGRVDLALAATGVGHPTTPAFSLTVDNTYTDSTWGITLPSAGTYLIWVQTQTNLNVSGGSLSIAYLMGQVYNSTDAAYIPPGGSVTTFVCNHAQVVNVDAWREAIQQFVYTVTASKTLKLHVARPAGPTWVTTQVLARFGYVKLSG